MTHTRVFVSYGRDSDEHARRVLDLAQRLRRDGVNAWLDLFEQSPDEGWPLWMERQVEQAAFVLVVCSAEYLRRYRGESANPDDATHRRKSAWQAVLTRQDLYDGGGINPVFIPVLVEGGEDAHIPTPLRPFTRYRHPGEYEPLYRYITGQPEIIPAPLGSVTTMPPVSQLIPPVPSDSRGLVEPAALGEVRHEPPTASATAEPHPHGDAPRPRADSHTERAASALDDLPLSLDRHRQWEKLLDTCEDRKAHAAVLVHGAVGQDVNLFCERIQRKIFRATRDRVIRLALSSDISAATTVAHWEAQLRVDIQNWYGDLDIVAGLHEVTRHDPLLVIVSDKNQALHGLDARQTDALVDFLGRRLPELIIAARPDNGVRVLVAVEHVGRARSDKLVTAVLKALKRASKAKAGITLVKPSEIEFPQLGDVDDYLRSHIVDPDDKLFDACHDAYYDFQDLPARERSFAGLTVKLTEIIEDWDRGRASPDDEREPA